MATAAGKATAEAITKSLGSSVSNAFEVGVSTIGRSIDDQAAALKALGVDEFHVKIDGVDYIQSKEFPDRKIKLSDWLDDVKYPRGDMYYRLADVLSPDEMSTSVQKNVNVKEIATQKAYNDALARSAQQRGAAEASFGKVETTAQKTKMQRALDVLFNKYTFFAGLTVALFAGIASRQNGCYLVDGEGQRLQKVSGGESTCSCGKMPPEKTSNSYYSEHALVCQKFCESDKNAGKQTDWEQCDTSCSCKNKDGTLSETQYFFKMVKMDIWDAFTNTLANVGYYVTEVVDDVIDIAKDALGGLTGILKYWWVFLIVVVVIIGLAVGLKYGLDADKKKKEQSSGSQPPPAPSGVSGGTFGSSMSFPSIITYY